MNTNPVTFNRYDRMTIEICALKMNSAISLVFSNFATL